MAGIEDTHLVALATSREAQRVEGIAQFLRSLSIDDLVAGYEEVKSVAPMRGRDGKKFFVERSPRPIERAKGKATEDLLEMALANDRVALPTSGTDVVVLMRQFPLFSTGSRKGIRAADLVGHGDSRFWVIELKAQPSKQYGETPVRALLEALIYGAVVEANYEDIAAELLSRLGLDHQFRTPGIIIAAPSGYWTRWQPTVVTGAWWVEYQRLLIGIGDELAVPYAVIDVGAISIAVDDAGQPRIAGGFMPRAVRF